MAHITQILGLVGTSIVMAAYVPQMAHIVREHCSGGVSAKAWAMWLLAALLVLCHALVKRDAVFIALQGVNAVAITTILILIHRFAGKPCHAQERPHAHPAREHGER